MDVKAGKRGRGQNRGKKWERQQEEGTELGREKERSRHSLTRIFCFIVDVGAQRLLNLSLIAELANIV